MATLASTLIARASQVLNDPTNIRWTPTEMLGWLNDWQREVVIHKPEANAMTANFTLAAGTKQSIPAGGTLLLGVIRNVSTGRAVRLTSREILDTSIPTWHNTANGSEVQHYTYDPLNPKTFYVYPPASGVTLEISYAAEPTFISAISGNISLDDIYGGSAIDYLCYRAYSKDAEYAQNGQAAVAHYTAFANALGISIKNSIERNPNYLGGGFNPNTPTTR